LHFAIGQVARRLGSSQFPVAENAFVQVLILNPSDHRTRYLLAQVYEQEGKVDEAFRECGYVLGPLGNSDPTVSQMYNRLRIRLGR
jgi:cytochrome c-type biogenesis protein CcmH/NrfG